MLNKRLSIIAFVLGLLLANTGWGEDLDIYGNAVTGVKPNCLIIFDTSGSMTNDDVPVNPYDASTSYACDPDQCYDSAKWYYWGTVVTGSHTECYDECEDWRFNWRTFSWTCNKYVERCVTYEDTENRWIEGGDIADIQCDDISSTLNSDGVYTPSWCNPNDSTTDFPMCTSENGGCDSDYARESSDMVSGNYLNYETAAAASTATNTEDDPDGDGYMTRTVAAKKVVTQIIEENSDSINFGIMRLYGATNGGRMVIECGASKENLLTTVAGLPATGGTPLGETLAEAGRYFAGLGSWYEHSYSSGDWWNSTTSTYVSPMNYSCQNNYVVLMTDGEPYGDGLHICSPSLVYKDNETISTNVNSNENYSCQDDVLADVAWYLNRADLNSTLEGTQNLQINTIGFGKDTSASSAVTLLRDTADNGGGDYFQASTSTSLENAFATIVNSMVEETSIFVAPVVPVNKVRRSADSELIYLAFFKPQSNGAWLGNIKKYNLATPDNYQAHGLTVNDIGGIYDREWKDVVNPDGTIRNNALDYWAVETVGNTGTVDMGGVGEQLSRRTAPRLLYTYIDQYYDVANDVMVDLPDNKDLTSEANSFVTTNAKLTNQPFSITTSQISNVHKTGYNWKLGDIVHAEPVVVHYPEKSVIYAGSNDAVFHCFDDATGSELWGFVPPDQFDRLDLLTATDNYAFIDGGITVTYNDQKDGDIYSTILTPRSLIFGERRGGKSFFALDISDYTIPKIRYQIDEGYLKTYAASQDNYEALGQSWVSPVSVKVSTGIDTDTENAIKQDAFVLTGGYDEDQDVETLASGYTDDTGRAVFIVNETTGELIFGVGNMEATSTANFQNKSEMKYCVTDVLATYGDYNYGENAGITNRLYFGDLGGNVFAVADDISAVTKDEDDNITITQKLADGTWPTFRKLFAGVADSGRKILYAPAVANMCSHELVMFGTGDRTHPNNTSITNRFYCVINDWYGTDPVEDGDLQNMSGSADWTKVPSPKGWYLEFSNPGEKVVSEPTLYNGLIIFSTYTPPSGTTAEDSTDPCGFSGARGQGRIYQVGIRCAGEDLEIDIKPPIELPPSNPMPDYTIVDERLRSGPDDDPLPVYMMNKYFYWRQQQ